MSNLVVRTNVFSLNTHRNLTNVGGAQRKSAQRLSSGYRINSAADDAAGLAISESMRAQIRGLDQASINAQDAVGLIQTAEGAMATISEMVIRIRELMVQAANDTMTFNNTSAQGNRDMIQLEIDQLMQEINDVTYRVQFNTRTLLDGGLTGGGGNTSPVSLQWMLLDQARHVGLSKPSGFLEPNSRDKTSFRYEIIRLQDEYNDLLKDIARRQIADGVLTEKEFDFNFKHLSVGEVATAMTTATNEGNINILQSKGINYSEIQRLRNITSRLNNAVQSAVRTAIDMFGITGDQILALGGQGTINANGTSVFMQTPMNDWFTDHHLWWEQYCRTSANGTQDYFSWYQGGFDEQGNLDDLRNSTFPEHDPNPYGFTGAAETLFHITYFTGQGAGTYSGDSRFDEIIKDAFSVQPNVVENGVPSTPGMAALSRAFRLLVGFEMDTGLRVAAHTDLRIPEAQRTSLKAFEDAWLATAAARRSLEFTNYAKSVNDVVKTMYAETIPTAGLSVLADLRNFPSVPPFNHTNTALINAVHNAITALSSAPLSPLPWPFNQNPPYQGVQAAFNAAISRGATFLAAENLFNTNAPLLRNLVNPPHTFDRDAVPLDSVVQDAIGALNNLNVYPFTCVGAIPRVDGSITFDGTDDIPAIPGHSIPETTGYPNTRHTPPIYNAIGTPSFDGIGSISGVNYNPAVIAGGLLELGHTLYHANVNDITSFPGSAAQPFEYDDAALEAAAEKAHDAAMNLNAPPFNNLIEVPNSLFVAVGDAYKEFQDAQKNYEGNPTDTDAHDRFQDAVEALQRAANDVGTAAYDALTIPLYNNFRTLTEIALSDTENKFNDIIGSFHTAVTKAVDIITNARNNANNNAHKAAENAYRMAKIAAESAVKAANSAVAANQWEALAAIRTPCPQFLEHEAFNGLYTNLDDWKKGPWDWSAIKEAITKYRDDDNIWPPQLVPFPGISTPPSLTFDDIHYSSPVGQLYVDTRNALAAFHPPSTTGTSTATSQIFRGLNLPPSISSTDIDAVNTVEIRDMVERTPLLPYQQSSINLGTPTITSNPFSRAWTVTDNTHSAVIEARDSNYYALAYPGSRPGGSPSELYASMQEAKRAHATPFDIPRYGFISRLENLLDKALNSLATVNLESNAMWFQTGANATHGMILQLQGIHTGVLGGGRGDLALLIDVREKSGIPISEQLDIIDTAEGIVNRQRAQLGAVQNRLEYTRQSVDISSENLTSAESRIRDTDMAKEMMRFTAAQVLQQAGISMLAQGNQLPSSILQLLQ